MFSLKPVSLTMSPMMFSHLSTLYVDNPGLILSDLGQPTHYINSPKLLLSKTYFFLPSRVISLSLAPSISLSVFLTPSTLIHLPPLNGFSYHQNKLLICLPY